MPESGSLIADKYRLERMIGSGGMAHVWKAEHEALGRTVAVKLLDVAGVGSKVRNDRFLREARTLAKLRHRHIVDVLDFGTSTDGQPFMVMEYLDGRTLADRLDAEPALSDAEIVRIVAQLAGGLAVVHEAGVVHRDVKPDNIFLVDDAEGSYAKLLDFGIAKGFGDAQRKLTNTGAVVGTPHYMSPEQARGLKDVDLRTDIYALGVILYEALAGCLPFDSENPGDILIMIVTREAPALETFRPDLPDELALIVERAMAKDREDRFASARELRDALLAVAPSLSGRAVRRRTPVAMSTTGQSIGAAAQSRRPTRPTPLPSSYALTLDPPSLPRTRAPILVALGSAGALVLAASGYGAWLAYAGGPASTAELRDAPDDEEPTLASAPLEAVRASTTATIAAEPIRRAPAEAMPRAATEPTVVPRPSPAREARGRARAARTPPAGEAPRERARAAGDPPVAPAPRPEQPRSAPSAPDDGYFQSLDY